jgi:hypothetical protein
MESTMSKIKIEAKIISMNCIKSRALERHLGETLAEKINYLDTLVDLIGAKLFQDISCARKEGKSSFVFLNFWTIRWSIGEGGKIELSSSCSATSSARNISSKFYANNNMLNQDIHDYFYSVISKPPGFFDYLTDLGDIAKQNVNLNKGDLSTGRHLAYLYHILFSEILEATYADGYVVNIVNLGTFEKKLKVKRKKIDGSKPSGYLQFTPHLF